MAGRCSPGYYYFMSRDLQASAPNPSQSGDVPFFQRWPVPPDLHGLVARITAYQENGQALHNAPEMAAMIVPMVISFSDPFEIALGRDPTAHDTYGSFTSGLYPGVVLISSTGTAQCVQIDFTPLGAYRFFGMPMSEIASRMVTLDDLGDGGICELRERLAAMNNWEARLEAVEQFARARLLASDPIHDGVAWAYETLLKRGGDIRIGDIAARLDWSRKHLNDRFRELVGASPKTVARMARFNNAVAIAGGGASLGWADIAAAAGYSDQAHLTREFRQFAGSTPRKLELSSGR
jgi:AraC-like DNA-binding protein